MKLGSKKESEMILVSGGRCRLLARLSVLRLGAGEMRDERPVFGTLEPDRVLQIRGSRQQLPAAMLTFESEGRLYAAFAQDIIARARPV